MVNNGFRLYKKHQNANHKIDKSMCKHCFTKNVIFISLLIYIQLYKLFCHSILRKAWGTNTYY